MRYRKISPHTWNDAKIRELSAYGALVFLFVITHPALTAIGAMRATAEGLAAEFSKKMSRKDFALAFDEGLSKGLFRYDEEACFLWFPNFIKYNNPESPNVVKAWSTAANLLPECHEKNQCLQGAKAFLETMPLAFREAFTKAMPKNMPNQEQEQEQYIKPMSGSVKKPRKPTGQVSDANICERIASILNIATGRNYRGTSAALVKGVTARMREGFVLDDFRKVIEHKTAQWLPDSKMNAYLRPETLFSTKFDSYLQEAGGSSTTAPDTWQDRQQQAAMAELLSDE